MYYHLNTKLGLCLIIIKVKVDVTNYSCSIHTIYAVVLFLVNICNLQ